MGRHSESEVLYQRALRIRMQQLGSEHPDTANVFNNLAFLYYVWGKQDLALDHLRQGLALQETFISQTLVGGSDADKRDLITSSDGPANGAINLHLNSIPSDPAAAELAFNSVIQRKGRILDIFTSLRTRLRDNPTAQATLDKLRATNDQLASFIYAPNSNISSETNQSRIKNLQTKIRNLEDELSRQSKEFSEITASPSLAEIQTALPEGSALVEFIRYDSVLPEASREDRFGDARYAAYVLKSDGTIQGIDLGAATDVDQAVSALSRSLSSPDSPPHEVKETAQTLETLIMRPIREILGTTTTVFLSPDGVLNLIPFEALVDESGNYLVEQYQFRYLTSGRDLMRSDDTTAGKNPALLIGNPTYGLPGAIEAQADTRSIDFKNGIFPILPGTQTEVNLIAEKLVSPAVYTQTNATEAVIKQQSQPSILHIATHGFFEPTEEVINPLLQSGLILAGVAAGRQSGPDQDGILTALEITGMNLSGTQLVVLSACETSLGELAAGEGVYGLRRALVLAGSQSQVLSLWRVNDAATQEFMVDYYDRLLASAPRDVALRETQLAFLDHEEYSHPYYWAAFIGSGNWQPLSLDN